MIVHPVGRRALLVEVPGTAEAQALYAELLRRRVPCTDLVPAARTVLIDGLADPARWAAEIPHWMIPPVPERDGQLIEIPVVYDGEDLAEVSERWGGPADGIHASFEYRVAFCGFAPGFGYLTGLPAQYHVPRLSSPRPGVPAGSVAVAGEYTGIYPRSSPGGWRLLGHTSVQLWDAGREPPALLVPGTRVRFVPA
ncbi:5-oxoprolinase subunit B family protein [Longispora albida]|uniref:5-oxoprolinase subunit B family protein n=1 Tax=Longispora albida TaxID=203523 RepID=UPI000380A506|nr:allophanate hydrolase subunit 1 [Longispora albida]